MPTYYLGILLTSSACLPLLSFFFPQIRLRLSLPSFFRRSTSPFCFFRSTFSCYYQPSARSLTITSQAITPYLHLLLSHPSLASSLLELDLGIRLPLSALLTPLAPRTSHDGNGQPPLPSSSFSSSSTGSAPGSAAAAPNPGGYDDSDHVDSANPQPSRADSDAHHPDPPAQRSDNGDQPSLENTSEAASTHPYLYPSTSTSISSSSSSISSIPFHSLTSLRSLSVSLSEAFLPSHLVELVGCLPHALNSTAATGTLQFLTVRSTHLRNFRVWQYCPWTEAMVVSLGNVSLSSASASSSLLFEVFAFSCPFHFCSSLSFLS